MFCQKCGTKNKSGSKFCTQCGNDMSTATVEAEKNVVPSVSSVKTKSTTTGFNLFLYILNVVINPVKTYKENSEEVKDDKNSLILTVLLAGVMTFANLVKNMILICKEKDYSFLKGYTTTWDISNLKELNYLNLIFKNFFIYLLIIVAVAGVFFLAGLVIKKSADFLKNLTISASALIPAAIAIMILGPILGLIWADLSVVVITIALIYSITTLTELVNIEYELEGSNKIYFYVICYSILFIVGYFALTRVYLPTLLKSFASLY